MSISILTLAEYSALAYESLDTVKAALPDAEVILIDHEDSQAYVIETVDGTVVAFRGTQVTSGFSMTDIIRNAKIKPVPSRSGLSQTGKVHRGYKEAVDVIADDLFRIMLDVRPPRHYTGHSLGGAMATFARTFSPYPDMTVTFGSPKVGNREFVKAYSRHPLIRYVNCKDIAPKHPRPWLGYRHGGSLVRISRSGALSHRPWTMWDELIIPGIAGIVVGTFDHRVGEYVDKLRGAET